MSDAAHTSVSVEQLLAHTQWVRALAARLTGGGADAEDLAQDVWMTALRQPPQHAAGLRGWLARVTRSRAHERRREAERRTRRERSAAAAESLTSTQELAARAEQHRRLVDRVLQLDEPSRSTILLRYFEDRSPAEIARLQSVPVETVRTRLKRAVARLRRSFDTDGDRGAGLALLLPMTAPAAVAAPSTVSTSAAAGVLLMSAKLKIACVSTVVLVCALAAWYASDAMRAATGSSEVQPVVGVRASETEASVARSAHGAGEVADPSRRPVEAPPAAAASGGELVHGVLRGLHPRMPWSGPLRVEFRGVPADGQGREVERECDLAAGGRFTFRQPNWIADATRLRVRLTGRSHGYAPIRRDLERSDLRTTPDRPLAVDVTCGCVLSGRVRGADGTAIEVAQLVAHPLRDGVPASAPVSTGHVLTDGTYEMLVPYSGPVLVVALATGKVHISGQVLLGFDDRGQHYAPDGIPSEKWQPGTAHSASQIGTEVEVPDIVLARAARITGTVSWPDRGPVAEAQVTLGHPQSPPHRLALHSLELAWWEDGSVTQCGSKTKTAADGSFSFAAAPGRAMHLDVDYVPGAAVHVAVRRRVIAPCTADIVLEGGVLDLSVQARGEPADCDVFVQALTGERGRERKGYPAPDGSTRLVLEPGITSRLEVHSLGRPPHVFEYTPLVAGVDERVIVLGERSDGVLVLALDASTGPDWVRVELVPLAQPSAPPIVREVVASVGKERAFRIRGVPGGRYRARLTRPRSALVTNHTNFMLDVEADVEVPVTGELTTRVPCTSGGRLWIRIVDARGLAVAGTCTLAAAGGAAHRPELRLQRAHRSEPLAPGEVAGVGWAETDANLPPGEYTLEVTAATGVVRRVPVVVRAGHVERVTVEV